MLQISRGNKSCRIVVNVLNVFISVRSLNASHLCPVQVCHKKRSSNVIFHSSFFRVARSQQPPQTLWYSRMLQFHSLPPLLLLLHRMEFQQNTLFHTLRTTQVRRQSQIIVWTSTHPVRPLGNRVAQLPMCSLYLEPPQ